MLLELKDFVGNEKAVAKLRECIKDNAACILHGDSGIGKTLIVYLLARELGYRVIETNASDVRKKDQLEEIWQGIRTFGLTKTIYLFDEADGISNWSTMRKIVKYGERPIVLTANDLYKIDSELKKFSVVIPFYRPRIAEVLNHVKNTVDEELQYGSYDKISQDIRHSLNVIRYGGSKYSVVNDFDIVNEVFSKGDVSNFTDQWIWLMDNAPRYYRGLKLFKSIKIISLASMYNDKTILELLPKGAGSPTQPYYIKRIIAMRKK